MKMLATILIAATATTMPKCVTQEDVDAAFLDGVRVGYAEGYKDCLRHGGVDTHKLEEE